MAFWNFKVSTANQKQKRKPLPYANMSTRTRAKPSASSNSTGAEPLIKKRIGPMEVKKPQPSANTMKASVNAPLTKPTTASSKKVASTPPSTKPASGGKIADFHNAKPSTPSKIANVNDSRAEVAKKQETSWSYTVEPFQCYLPSLRKYEKNYPSIDNRARNAPKSEEKSIEHLAKYLTEPYTTVEEKARSIYVWITENIQYDVEGLRTGINTSYTAESSWKSKKAVCSGYSDLFAKFCSYCDVPCETINGYAKGASYVVGKPIKETNHAWTAVKLETGQYRLIESTWGSGSVNGPTFTKRFSDRYFFMSPYEFICAHFPSDPKWQLLDTPVTKTEFEEHVRITDMGYEQGLRTVTHHKGCYLLKETNESEIIFNAKPGTNWLFNLKEKNGSSPLWECANPSYNDDRSVATLRFYLPKKDVDYELLVFLGAKEPAWGCSYIFKANNEAKMNLSGFPLKYESFHKMKVQLKSPTVGKLQAGSEVTFSLEIPQKVQVMLAGNCLTQAMFKPNGYNYELKCKMPSTADKLTVFAGQGSLQGILQYTVE